MKLENNNKLNETYKTETYGLQTKNVCKKTKGNRQRKQEKKKNSRGKITIVRKARKSSKETYPNSEMEEGGNRFQYEEELIGISYIFVLPNLQQNLESVVNSSNSDAITRKKNDNSLKEKWT